VELRRRAFAGLREVLARTGARKTLVVHLDDLQWGDVDSALMLAELLLPPRPPRLLLLAGFRSEDRESSPFLSRFLETLQASPAADRRELPLDVLSDEEARDLAGQLLAEANRAVATVVARESGGNPFFIYQLVQAIQARDSSATLDSVIWDRVSGFPDNQRR